MSTRGRRTVTAPARSRGRAAAVESSSDYVSWNQKMENLLQSKRETIGDVVDNIYQALDYQEKVNNATQIADQINAETGSNLLPGDVIAYVQKLEARLEEDNRSMAGDDEHIRDFVATEREHRLGQRKGWEEAERQELLELVNRDLSYKDMADQLNVQYHDGARVRNVSSINHQLYTIARRLRRDNPEISIEEIQAITGKNLDEKGLQKVQKRQKQVKRATKKVEAFDVNLENKQLRAENKNLLAELNRYKAMNGEPLWVDRHQPVASSRNRGGRGKSPARGQSPARAASPARSNRPTRGRGGRTVVAAAAPEEEEDRPTQRTGGGNGTPKKGAPAPIRGRRPAPPRE